MLVGVAGMGVVHVTIMQIVHVSVMLDRLVASIALVSVIMAIVDNFVGERRGRHQ